MNEKITLSFELTLSDISIVDEDGIEIAQPEKTSVFIGGCQPGFEEKYNGTYGNLEIE